MAIDIDQSHYNTGTATVAGTAVTGTGTAWVGTLRKGDLYGTHRGAGVRIAAVLDNTHLTLAYDVPDLYQAAGPYEIQRTPYDVGYLQAIEDMIRFYGLGNLPALAGLDGTGGDLGLMLDGVGAAATFSLTAFARSLLADTSIATALTTLGLNNGSGQSTATARLRKNGNAFEFGHVNQAGYGSALGAEAGTGKPFVVFSAEAGTANSSYMTRGQKGSGLRGDLAGGIEFISIPDAAADNQTAVVLAKFKADGSLSSVTEQAPKFAPRSLLPRLIDNHFGCMHGVGFIDGVDSGTISFVVAAPIAKGAMSFAYSGTAPGGSQLLVFLGTDGQYYTAVTAGSSAGTCTMRSPIPCDVAAGATCWNFWDNDAHPNAKGYAAIDDYALRQDFSVWRDVYLDRPRAYGTSTIAISSSNNMVNPGSATSEFGWTAAPTAANSGAQWRFKPARPGMHRAVFSITKLASGSGDILVEAVQAGEVIASYTVNTVDCSRHELDFFVSSLRPVTLRATRAAGNFITSNMRVLELVGDSLKSLNWGKHMVFGDSWVANPDGVAARLTARLTNATVVKSGVGGNEASALVARFDADVGTVPDLDFVWIVVGTNDVAHGITPTVFTDQLSILVAKVRALGAIPILFTVYPGCTNLPARMDLAKVYMAQVPYYENARADGAYAAIADDAAFAFTLPPGYLSYIVSLGCGSNPAVGGSPNGLIFVRPGLPLAAPIGLASATGITFRTGVLAGTTGVDGQMSISAHTDGKLYIENRTGGAKEISISVQQTTGG